MPGVVATGICSGGGQSCSASDCYYELHVVYILQYVSMYLCMYVSMYLCSTACTAHKQQSSERHTYHVQYAVLICHTDTAHFIIIVRLLGLCWD